MRGGQRVIENRPSSGASRHLLPQAGEGVRPKSTRGRRGRFTSSRRLASSAKSCDGMRSRSSRAGAPIAKLPTGFRDLNAQVRLGPGKVVGRIDVEERVERFVVPCRDRDAEALGENFDFSYAFGDDRASQRSASATGHSATTWWRFPPDAATAIGAPVAFRAACSRAARSRGANGVSTARVRTSAISGFVRRANSSPASTPASGPAKSWGSSATIGSA